MAATADCCCRQSCCRLLPHHPPTLITPGVSPALLSGRYCDSSATNSLFLSICVARCGREGQGNAGRERAAGWPHFTSFERHDNMTAANHTTVSHCHCRCCSTVSLHPPALSTTPPHKHQHPLLRCAVLRLTHHPHALCAGAAVLLVGPEQRDAQGGSQEQTSSNGDALACLLGGGRVDRQCRTGQERHVAGVSMPVTEGTMSFCYCCVATRPQARDQQDKEARQTQVPALERRHGHSTHTQPPCLWVWL
jgi:hypothetical protein